MVYARIQNKERNIATPRDVRLKQDKGNAKLARWRWKNSTMK